MIEQTPVLRPASRVLLIDEQDRLLLLCARLSRGDVWITPGGGLDPGESPEAGALRELWEETGVQDVELGPCVWTRRFVYQWGDHVFDQRDQIFVVRVVAPEISADHWDAEEQETLVEWRWWTLAELQNADAVFSPGDLPNLLAPILAGDYPASPQALDT
jgi:8-oxo-dGTP pyrophosphatase MutT (NUDIX family)